MTELYNSSFMNNATNIVDLMVGVGQQLGDGTSPFLMGHMIMATFFIIFLILGLRYDFMQILLIDCFLTTVVGILLFIAGLVPVVNIILPAIALFIVLVFYYIG